MKLSAYNNQALSSSSASQPLGGVFLFQSILSRFFPSVYFLAMNLAMAKANIAGIFSELYLSSYDSSEIDNSTDYFY